MVLGLILVIIYISFISLGLPDSLLGASWPKMYLDLGVPVSSAGIVAIIASSGTIISAFFSDKVIKRFGTGLVTAVSVLLTCVAVLTIAFTRNFVVMCLLGIPLGIGAGGVDAALNNFVALNYKAKHMSWLHCFWGIGATLSPIIMSICMSIGGWPTGYLTVGTVQLGLVVCLFASLPLWKKAETKAETESSSEQISVGFGTLLKMPGALPTLIAFFCYSTIESTVGLWGNSYLVFARNLTPEHGARLVALFFFGITFGRMISGFLTLKFNNRQMILLGLAVLAAGVLCAFVPYFIVAQMIGFFLVGLGCAPIFPSLLHQTPTSFGAEYSQAFMGKQMAFAYLGGMTMPALFGVIAARFTYQLFPYYLAGWLTLMVLMVIRMNKKLRKL